MNTATNVVGGAGIGAGMLGLGITSSVVGKAGGNTAVKKVGGAISNFGTSISNKASNPNSALGKIGNFITRTGSKIGQSTPSSLTKNLIHHGMSNIRGSFNNLMPQRAMSRNRYRAR